MGNFYLYGASGHGKVIYEILKSCNENIAGVFDDFSKEKVFFEAPVIGSFQNETMKNGSLIISIGDNHARKNIAQKTAVTFGKAIHAASVISSSALIKEGTVIMAGAVVNAEAQIGKHVILNTNCSVDHHCIIEDYVHIAPNSALAGNVTVGEGSMLGVGVSVIPGVKIGKWCIVGAGAAVVNDIPDYAIVVGVPAKIIKYNKA